MSCNELVDNRISFKTDLPSNMGDFWLGRGTDRAKEYVRLFTRLSTQNNALTYLDYVENLISVTTAHINSLPTKIKWKDFELTVRNFTPDNFSTTSHNGFPIESIIPLRKQDANREGVYLLDPELMRIWQDPNGQYWLWQIQKDPENIISPYPGDFNMSQTIFMSKQPEYVIEWGDVAPSMILSKKGYLLYGLDFRVETGFIIFTEPLEELFDEFIHIVSGYEKRKTLLGFPFSIDPETPGVEHITKFLRYNSSAKNLERALSQVVGHTSVPDIKVGIQKLIPMGNIIIGVNGELITTIQENQALSNYANGEFPGKPITVITGDEEGAIEFISTKSSIKLPSIFGNIHLEDKDYGCVVEAGGFVAINVGNVSDSIYLNTLRKEQEAIPRYAENGDPLPTLSQYLITTYNEDVSTVGSEFSANILRVYLELFGYKVLLVLLAPHLNSEQTQAAIDFLQTHTPVNAIILTDTIWE